MVGKYKNPEKHIKTLKVRLERMTRLFHEWRGKYGVCVLDWEGHDIEQNLLDDYFEGVNPGRRVAIIGIVKSVENSMDLPCKNKHGRLVIHVEETRVLPD